MVSSGARGSPSSLHEEVVEKYPSFDTLRDSTAIESTNSLDLNKVLNTPNERGNGGGEKKKGRKKQSILEECAEVVLNEGRRTRKNGTNEDRVDGSGGYEEVPEPQIVYLVKKLAALAAARTRENDDDIRQTINGHHQNGTSNCIATQKQKRDFEDDDDEFNGIETDEEADIVMMVFETIAERESALLRETCAESLGLLSKAFLAVDSMYEEKLLETAFVLLEDDDPDVVKKTEEQFAVICENITKYSIDQVLIPHVINVMIKENDEQLRISSLNVLKNILVGTGNGISFVETCYCGGGVNSSDENHSGDKDLKTMDEMIECFSNASQDENYRVRETFIQNAVEVAIRLKKIIPTVDEPKLSATIETHMKVLIDGIVLLCEDENWAVRFNCVKSLHALAKLSLYDTEKSAITDINTDKVLDLFEKLSNDVSKKVKLMTSCELGNIIASLLPGNVNDAKLSGMIQRYCETVREMSMNRSSANAKDVDIEQIRISCASYFGAMCKKLAPMGKWDDIVEAFRLLSSRPLPSSPIDEGTNNSDPNWLFNSNAHKARLEIAKSLETIANSLSGDDVVRDILPVVEATFLNDSNDEVKIVTISQLHHLLQKKCSVTMKNESTANESKNTSIRNLLSSLAEDSSSYVPLSPSRSRKPGAVATDSVGSWRVRLELASSLGNISNNMPFQPQPSSLLSISLKLLKDPVNDVRKAASSMDSFYFVFKNSLPLLFSEPPTWSSSSRTEYKDASNAIESIIKMASSKVWTERRTFAECSGRALLALGKQEEKIQNQDKKLLQMQNTLLTKLCFLMTSDAVSSVRLAALEALAELISRDNSLADDSIVLSALKNDGNKDSVGSNAIVVEARTRLSNVINEVSFSKISVS
jgi:hypothetical protein